MECKHLFCHEKAALKISVPMHEKETPMCEKHAQEQIEWAAPYRSRIGAVQITPIH